MTILLLCLAITIVVVTWCASRVHITHRWRRRQVSIMCKALCGHDRHQPSALSYARRRAMDALAFEKLLLESFERRGRRVIRNRRYNGDAGIDGQVMFERRVWLIQVKRYGGAIGPEHVRAFAALCTDRGVPGLLIHTGRTGRISHEVVARHGIVDIVPGAAAVGSGRRRSHRYRREGAVMPKLPLIYAVLAAAIIIPGIAQARGKRTVAEEREIAGCIHRSARGKPWLETALSAVHDLEGGWIGAQVRNRNGSHDLGPMQINSWWVPRFANLLAQPPVKIQQWLRQDACFNVEAARWILLQGLARTGNVWSAIGVYHSPRPGEAHAYAGAVHSRMRLRFLQLAGKPDKNGMP